ncbi:MAG: 4Fe-4S binding protein [Desulfobulbaceae bacterium]|nr:4Fe-4S binding protein [Desulfobulbaceae bacterium]
MEQLLLLCRALSSPTLCRFIPALSVCPHGVFVVDKGKAVMAARNLCMECGACMRNCPSGAISVEAGEGCVRGIINKLLGIDGPCC